MLVVSGAHCRYIEVKRTVTGGGNSETITSLYLVVIAIHHVHGEIILLRSFFVRFFTFPSRLAISKTAFLCFFLHIYLVEGVWVYYLNYPFYLNFHFRKMCVRVCAKLLCTPK